MRFVGLALLAALLGCADPEPAPRGLLVICVDTLRADRVGHLGSGRATAPEIDALAARGTTFTSAFAPAPFTAPSMATMMTGVSPLVHGVRSWSNFGRRYRGPTAPQVLHAHGWRTGFLGANGFLAAIRPVRRGFDDFEDIHDRPGPALTRRALGWIDGVRRGKAPWFLWVHYYDPHAPYRAHEEHGETYAPSALRARFDAAAPETLRGLAPGGPDWGDAACLFTGLYDGEVAFADAALGALLRGLDERGLTRSTTVILTADHGENLADHAPHFTHREALFDSLVHVPLVIAGPGIPAARRVTGLAPLENLPRTILDIAGAPVPDGIGGRSLLAPELGPTEVVFADAGLQEARRLMARTPSRKVLRHGEGTEIRHEAYDLARDPGETHPTPVPASDPLARLITKWVGRETKRHAEANGPDDGRPDEWTSDELRQLRAFGYLR